jgi:hypothetical protein
VLPTADRPQDHLGPPQVSLSPQVPEDLAALWPDLQALAHWWQERQRLAQQDETPDRKLVRQTYHSSSATSRPSSARRTARAKAMRLW